MRRRLPLLLAIVAACAVLPAASASAAPVVGVNASGVPVGAPIDEALATGAKEVRVFLLWRDLEPDAKGRFAPGIVKAYTDIVGQLTAGGARANFVFTGSPQWASGSTNPNTPPR